MEFSDDTVLKLGAEVRWREYLKSVIIEPGIALNETAVAIFRRLDGTRTVGQISQEVAAEFDIDHATCHADLCDFIRDMVEQGLLSRPD